LILCEITEGQEDSGSFGRIEDLLSFVRGGDAQSAGDAGSCRRRERLIAAEKALEDAFATGKVDEPSLRRLLADAESARSELRFIHLSQHDKTVQFLKPEQIKRYNILRGYAEDPCKNIPAGHNPEMYKRHMGCN
jgi:hypothetical protein